MEQYIVDDILHYLLLICDIKMVPNLIVNKHMYHYCFSSDQSFWKEKLKYCNLPYIKHIDSDVLKQTLYAQYLAKQIIIMNKNTKYTYNDRKIISFDFTRTDIFNQIPLPKAFNEAITFNMQHYDMPCDWINIKLLEDSNQYKMSYRITNYNTGNKYLKLKMITNESEVEKILITLLFGCYGLKEGYFEFHTYFLDNVTVTNDQHDNYLVHKKQVVVYENYDKEFNYG